MFLCRSRLNLGHIGNRQPHGVVVCHGATPLDPAGGAPYSMRFMMVVELSVCLGNALVRLIRHVCVNKVPDVFRFHISICGDADFHGLVMDSSIKEDSYGTQSCTHSEVLKLLKVSKPQELASTIQACCLLCWSIDESLDDQVRKTGPWHLMHVQDYQTPAILTGLCHLAA